MKHIIGHMEIPLVTLLFGLLGAPTAWLLHLGASYVVVATGCTTGWSGTGSALVASTILFAALAALAGFTSLRVRRGLRVAGGLLESIDRSRGLAAFFMLIGTLGAALFLLLILLNGISPLFVPTCWGVA
jgi:hypothetical protein